MPSSSTPRVVILGGGFAGLSAARHLAGVPVRVTLIDKHNYHLFRPLMYQVATGLLSADEIAAPLRSILHNQKNVEVIMAEVQGVDTERKLVQMAGGSVPYDFLIVATGIKYNYFGHDDWKDVAPGLDTVDDADRIRGKILLAFEAAERAAVAGASGSSIEELLTFVIVGAGTAGVEMAGTIAEMAHLALSRDFRHIDPRSAHIFLFEALPRVIPNYSADLSAKAQRHLEDLGVKVFTGTPVQQVDSEGVIVGGKRIRSRTVTWSAGVLASPAGLWLGAETDKNGRVKVNSNLSVPGHEDIFIVGDTAAAFAYSRNILGIQSKQPGPMPGVAQPAIQEGAYVAKLVRNRVLGKADPPVFWYWDKGSLAVIGRTFAVADLGIVRFSGFFAWLLWGGVHIYFLIGYANRFFVMTQWVLSFLLKRREVRIFPGQPQDLSEMQFPTREGADPAPVMSEKQRAS